MSYWGASDTGSLTTVVSEVWPGRRLFVGNFNWRSFKRSCFQFPLVIYYVWVLCVLNTLNKSAMHFG